MPDYTQNLNLEKPLDNETADIGVINSNMDKIDEQFGSIQGHTHNGTAGQGPKIDYNDLNNKPTSMTPTTHKSTHASGGSDAITPADIGAIANSAGSVTDSNIGNRTADQTQTPSGATGTITQLFSWLANRIKAITGGTNWWDAPAATLASLLSLITSHTSRTDNPHSTTAAQVGAVSKAGDTMTGQLTVPGLAFPGKGTTDLNTITTSGMYRIESGNPNAPSGVAYGQLLVINGAGDTIAQIVTDYASNNIYWRSGNPSNVGGSGAWGPWQKIWHSGNDGHGSGSDADVIDGYHAESLAKYIPIQTAATIQNNTTLEAGFYTTSEGLKNADGSTFKTGWWHIINMHHSHNNGHNAQIAIPLSETSESMYWRCATAGTWSSWRKVVDESNWRSVINLIQPKKPRDAYGSVSMAYAGTWYTVANVSGRGILHRITGYISDSASASNLAIRVTIDGTVYTFNLGYPTVIGFCRAAGSDNAADLILNTYFESSLTLEISHNFTSNITIYGYMNYSVE